MEWFENTIIWVGVAAAAAVVVFNVYEFGEAAWNGEWLLALAHAVTVYVLYQWGKVVANS